MDSQSKKRNDGTMTAKVVCAVVFCMFAFSYLFFYQADILAVAQHVLSCGATRYNRTSGAVIITAVLLLLQVAVAFLTKLTGSRHAITYFPSLLILAILTSPDISTDGSIGFGAWLWATPLLIAAWAGAVAVARKIPYGRPTGKGMSARTIWTNVLTLCAMFIFTGATGSSNDVLHYRMRAENRLLHGNFEGALEAGARSLRTDGNLTMLRAYALARKGELGESLFTYPIDCKGSDLLPVSGETRCMMYPTDSIYRFLGARPAANMTTETYLKALLRGKKASTAVKDYLLCVCLVDRDLDGFARLLPRYYDTNSHLPRHYREALTLYTHLRSNPILTYHDDITATDFKDLQTMEKQYNDPHERRLAIFDHYNGTYWWYYEYGSGSVNYSRNQ